MVKNPRTLEPKNHLGKVELSLECESGAVRNFSVPTALVRAQQQRVHVVLVGAQQQRVHVVVVGVGGL